MIKNKINNIKYYLHKIISVDNILKYFINYNYFNIKKYSNNYNKTNTKDLFILKNISNLIDNISN